MAEKDVIDQIREFGAQSSRARPGPITKLTVDRTVADWLSDFADRMNPEIGRGSAISAFNGVPVVIDDEFWPGQVRIHRGDEFDDRYIVVPPRFPRFEPATSDICRQYTFAQSARAYMAAPDKPWQFIGTVQGVTMPPTGT